MQSVHHIVDDPAGDIVISVGMEGRLVRAHRNILIMSSPVFKTLLAHHTRGYCGLMRHSSANDPLLLIADNPDAFIDFCTVLHQQAVGPEEIPLHRLPAVAVVADKYGCSERLRPVLASPFHSFFDNMEIEFKTLEAAGVCPIATISTAYTTNDAKLFARATRWLLIHTGHRELLSVPQNSFIELLPPLLFEHMATIIENALDKLDYTACHEPVGDVFMHTPWHNPCRIAIQHIGLLTFNMCKVKRGEQTFRDTLMSLEEVWEAVRSVGEIVRPGPKFDGGYGENLDGCSTGCCVVDMKETLDDAVQRSMDAVQGLCLSCLKTESLAGLSSCECIIEY